MRKRIDSLNTDGSTGSGASASVNSNLSPESHTALMRARDKIIPFVDQATQSQLEALAGALEAASPDGEVEARQALESAIPRASLSPVITSSIR